MRSDIDAFFSNDATTFTRRLAELDRRLDPSAEAHHDEILEQLTVAGDECLAACRNLELRIASEPQLLKDVQERFLRKISPWYDRSWFMYRSRVKPRGYPGDYELLAAIYDRAPKSRGLGGYLDLYILNSTLGRSVLFRMQAVRRFLIEELSHRSGDVFVLNVASGPCREYRGGLGQPDDCKLHITCLDSDKEALEYVRTQVAPQATGIENINYACYNAFRLSSSKATITKFGRSDIIYSVGLFDYIPDKPLLALLRGIRESVNEDGVVYIAFKDCRRYDKTVYQWMLDWFFLQRTEEECRSLFEQAGYNMDRIEMTRDETGSIMNFVSRAEADRVFRVDRSETQRKKQEFASKVVHLAHPLPATPIPEPIQESVQDS